MAITRQDIIDNLLEMMGTNSSSKDAAASQLRFAEEIADSIIDFSGDISALLPLPDLVIANALKQYFLRVNAAFDAYEWFEWDGNGNDPDAIHKNVAGEISALTLKALAVGGDHLLIEDSESTLPVNAKKRVPVSGLPYADIALDALLSLPPNTASREYVLRRNADGTAFEWFDTDKLEVLQPLVVTIQGPANNFTTIFGAAQNRTFLGGQYSVSITYGWAYDAANSDFRAKFFVDGNELQAFGDLHRQEPKDSAGSGPGTGSDQQMSFAMKFKNIAITAGAKPIDLQITSSGNNVEASVWNVVIEFERTNI